eukprot:g1221.t1
MSSKSSDLNTTTATIIPSPLLSSKPPNAASMLLAGIRGRSKKKKKKKNESATELRRVNVMLGRSLFPVKITSGDRVEDLIAKILKIRPEIAIRSLVYRSKSLNAKETLGACGVRNDQKIYVEEKHVKENADPMYWIQCGLSMKREAVLMEKGLTFKSYFVDIKPSEAQVIIAFYETWVKEGKKSSFASSVPKSLVPLSKRIDDTIQKYLKHSGAFVKLTTRSPKDSPIAVCECAETLRKTATSDEPDLNERLATTANAIKDSLHVHSGREALLHFLYSNRIYEDLCGSLAQMKGGKYYDDEGKGSSFEQQIAVREYVRIPIDSEFRAFVWKGKLCAASQYHYHTFFKSIVAGRDAIAADIKRFFEVFHPIVSAPSRDDDGNALPPLTSYTCDIGRLKGGSKMILVEVNPFDGWFGTLEGSTCLFDWTDDRAQLTGLNDFELRVREKPEDPVELKKKLRKDWLEMVVATTSARPSEERAV